MKKQIFSILTVISLAIASCSGNKVDGSTSGKDTTVRANDTAHDSKDSSLKDSTDQKSLADSTTNAPRMPGQ